MKAEKLLVARSERISVQKEKEYKLENEGNVEQRNKNETKKLKEDTNFHL